MQTNQTIGLLFVVIGIAILAYGVTFTHAEEFTYDTDWKIAETDCTEVINIDDVPVATCIITGDGSGYTSEQYNVPEGYQWNEETQELEITPEYEAEARQECKDSLTCPAGDFQLPDGEIINYDDIIEEGKIVLAERAAREAEPYRCYNDISLYQGGQSFIVPITIWIDKNGNMQIELLQNKAVKTDTFTSAEELAVQACIGQWKLEISDNIHVRSVVPNVDDYFPYHADVAFGIPPITQEMVNNDQNKDRDPNLSWKNIVCNGSYDFQYQKSMGCEKFDDGGDKPAMKEYDDSAYVYFNTVSDDRALAKIIQEKRDEFNAEKFKANWIRNQ